jgi:hypothetical protein
MDMNNRPPEHDQNAKVTLQDPRLLSIKTYWKTLRSARRVPARCDLNTAQIDEALPYSFILQRVAPGTARFRVAGQTIHDLLKMDARGMPLTTLFQSEVRSQIKDLIEMAFSGPAMVGLPLVSRGTMLQPTVYGAMLLLPMQDAQDNTNRVLGAFLTQPITCIRPRRFGIDPAQTIRTEALGPTLAASQLIPRDPVKQKGTHVMQHTALRLVVNNG